MKLEEEYTMIGNRIQLRRKELHLKQSELAEILDISNNHMSAIENAREKPSLDILLKICHALKVTPDYLLLGNTHQNNVPQNIIDGLKLCSEEDIELTRQFIELLIERNQNSWNKKYFV